MPRPSASFSATLRVRLENAPGSFASVGQAIGEAHGLLDAIDLVRVEPGTKVRDVTVLAEDAAHIDRIAAAVQSLEGVEVEHVSDLTFLLHLGGKIEVRSKAPLKTRDDLSMAYTPGVARVSAAIAEDPEKVWNLTVKRNAVAIVTDGSAVLGLGDIGPEAALPVMEGLRDVIGCDRQGAVYPGRPSLESVKASYAQRANPRWVQGTADDALVGADVYIGLSGPGAVSLQGIRAMAADPIVFAMANPTPEVIPEDVQGIAAIVATGRSDYPNQINNVLAFPGVFRGALDVRASTITREMKFAAAHAIASVVKEDELEPEYIIPSVFNPEVTPTVAAAIAEAAERMGITNKPRGPGAPISTDTG